MAAAQHRAVPPGGAPRPQGSAPCPGTAASPGAELAFYNGGCDANGFIYFILFWFVFKGRRCSLSQLQLGCTEVAGRVKTPSEGFKTASPSSNGAAGQGGERRGHCEGLGVMK